MHFDHFSVPCMVFGAGRFAETGAIAAQFGGKALVVTHAGASAQEAWRYRAFFHSMLDAGVYLPPSAFEAWFVSAAHDQAALDRVVAALPAAARAAAEDVEHG